MIARRTVYADCPCCAYQQALSATFKDGKTLYHCHAGCSQEDLWSVMRGNAPRDYQTRPEPPPRASCETATAYARELWQRSLPAKDTLVVAYLASRGLICKVPDALRFLPDHLHKPSGTRWPVMLARVEDVNGALQAVHRTYLARDGQGKAPVEPAKMTLGPVGGFACHLALAGERLVVTEGIETGLAVMVSTGLPTWAALSAGGIRNLILPPLPLAREITICADNDPVGICQLCRPTLAGRGPCCAHCLAARRRNRLQRYSQGGGAMTLAAVKTMIDNAAPADGWPEPDIALYRAEDIAPPAFDPASLPSDWRTWCAAMAEAKACPVDFIVANLLTSASAWLGNARRVAATQDWEEPPHIWSAIVAPPSAGKTPSQQVFTQVCKTLKQDAEPGWEALLAEHEKLAAVAAAKRDAWEAFVLFENIRREAIERARTTRGLAAGWHGKTPSRALRLALIIE